MDDAKTADAKPHYPILDGLRGTAALLVVAFHLMESVRPDQSANLMRHGYLAVDFFFALSGYVIGYAYDDRWPRLSRLDFGKTLGFLKTRLIRLHPVVVIGPLLGIAAYFLDPFTAVPHTPTLVAALVALVAGVLLIPSWTLPDRGTDYFPYNGVFWTLFFEYAANLVYVFVLRSLGKRWLTLLTIVAALILVWRAAVHNTIHLGYDWHTLEMAPVRLAYPFLAGLLLQRSVKTSPIPRGWLPLSAVLLALFAAPWIWVRPGVPSNGLYDAAVVIIAFPLIIMSGAHSVSSKAWTTLCSQLGRLSYPLYGTHYALIYVYADWIQATKPALSLIIGVGVATWLVAIAVAWAVVFLWDEPIRRWLSAKGKPAKA